MGVPKKPPANEFVAPLTGLATAIVVLIAYKYLGAEAAAMIAGVAAGTLHAAKSPVRR